MNKSESIKETPNSAIASDANHQEKPPTSRQKYASRQACSSRTLVSLDSVESILYLESDSENDSEDSEHSTATGNGGYVLNPRGLSASSRDGTAQVEERHITLIQASWEKLLGVTGNNLSTGKKIIAKIVEIKPAEQSTIGVDPSKPSPRFALLANNVVDILDRIVKMLGPCFCDQDLIMMGEEWLEEGLDAKLVHKAVIQCLEESLDADDYSYETAEAWESTFKDVLKKMIFMY